jgi:hypothetical protein
MLRATLLLLAALLLQVLESFGIPLADRGNQTRTLQERQCVYNAQASRWDCDDNLPTVQEIIVHLQNTAEGGRATAENSVFFYSELGNFVAGGTGPALWILGWQISSKVSSSADVT